MHIHKNAFRMLFAALVLISLFLQNCSRNKVDDATVVAKIGNRVITAKDFRINYELAPIYPKKSSTDIAEKKRTYLHQMVEKNLLAIAGEEAGLDQQESTQRVIKWYERQAVVHELYQQVVHDRVQVSEDEARDAFTLLNERLLLRQIWVKSDSAARRIARRLRQGATFEQVALEQAKSDSELAHMLTPREFTWGELDEKLETAAYGLNLHEISAPIKTRGGYHFLQLVNRTKNMLLTEYSFQERRHYVETIIRRRKEARLARQYARSLMEDLRPQAVGPVLLQLTQKARQVIKSEREKANLPPYAQAHIVRPYLHDLLDKKLVVFKGGYWTVADFLDRVEHAHPEARPDLTQPGKLAFALSVMVRDEFLAREGYRRRLDQHQAVREEVQRVRDEILALRMKNALLDSVKITEPEVAKYFKANLTRYQIPERVRLREVMVRDRRLADSLYALVQNGASLAELARKYSVRKWAAKKGGDLGYFARGAFGDVGKKAFTMQVGEIAAPVPVKVSGYVVGYSVFKVIDRVPTETPNLKSIYDKVAKEALQHKKDQILAQFLEKVKSRHKVRVNESILASIRTTDELAPGKPIEMFRVVRQ